MRTTTELRAAWFDDNGRQYDDLTKLIAAQPETAAALEVLERAVRQGTGAASPENQKAAIQTLKANYAHLDHTLREMAPPKFFNRQHDLQSSMTAAKFFDVAEITEMVCGFLSLPDILAMQRVNKRTSTIVQGSTKLQEKLKMTFEMPIEITHTGAVILEVRESVRVRMRFPPVNVFYDDGSAWGHKEEATVTVRCEHDLWDQSVKPGPRMRQHLILSPSLTEMRVSASCCRSHHPGSGYPRIYRIMNKDGITIGDLYDAYIQVQAQHKMCPYAAAEHHNSDGSVRTPVKFLSVLPDAVKELCREHLRKHREAMDLVWDAARGDEGCERARMQAYCAAKRSAFKAGSKIPTLAEFETDQTVRQWISGFKGNE